MKRALAVALVLLSLSMAFAIGRWSAPSNPVVEPCIGTAVEARVVERVTTQADAACDQELEAMKSSMALANAIIDAGIRERTGAPVAFPPGLPPQYTAEHFEASVLEAMANCPDSRSEVAHIDCSEYPCMAFFSSALNSSDHDWLLYCEAWRATFDECGAARLSFMTDDGPLEFNMTAPLPARADLDANALTRWQFRLDQGRAMLMDTWGGRVETPLEEAD